MVTQPVWFDGKASAVLDAAKKVMEEASWENEKITETLEDMVSCDYYHLLSVGRDVLIAGCEACVVE